MNLLVFKLVELGFDRSWSRDDCKGKESRKQATRKLRDRERERIVLNFD